MQKFKRIALQYGIPLVSLALPLFASAQLLQGPPGGVTAPTNLVTTSNLATSVCNAINWLFYGLILLAIIFVFIAAFRYLTASGDPEKVKTASNTLLYAVIAVIVALIAKGVPSFAGSIIGNSVAKVC